MKKIILGLVLICVLLPFKMPAQNTVSDLSPEEIEQYKKQVAQLVEYLEGTLNFLGDPNAPPKEKEIVVNESYLKIFKNDKVQIEDDLDEKRDVPLHKDVQAYLKDIMFFFRKAEFKFHIVSIEHFVNENNVHYFKVTFNRDLIARTVNGDSINSRKIRYMEVNLDLAKNDLKIASIYTTKLNEKEEIRNWWNGLTAEWRKIFGEKVILFDSIHLSDVAYFEDSLLLVARHTEPVDQNDGHFQLELPEERANSMQENNYDTLYLKTKSIMIYLAGILKQQEIDISGNEKIRKLDPLSELTQLQSINCSNTLVISLFPLRNLNKLELLNCSNTPVNDMLPLQYSNSLKRLNISFTLVNDPDPVGGLSQLEYLDLSGLRISDLGFLENLQALQTLKIDDTQAGNISPLSELTNLEELDMSGTRIRDLDEIAGLVNLKNLDCDKTSVSSLDPLKNLKNLEVLRISNTMVDSLDPLNGLPNLKRIYWDSDEVYPGTLDRKRKDAIAFMKKNPGTLVIFESEELAKSWKELEEPWKDIAREAANLSENPSKEELHALLQVETVHVDGHQIITLNPVKRLYNLKNLDISGVHVNDYSPLGDALELENLDMSGSTVQNLDFASNLSKLKVLDISGTKVSSLAPLNDLRDLKIIYADSSGITGDEAFRFAAGHPGCVIIFETNKLKNWWNEIPEAWKYFFTSQYKIDSPPSTEQLHGLVFQEEIDIPENAGIISLSPITMLQGLKVLKMKGLQISDLTPLTQFSGLTGLQFNQMPVIDLTPLASLSKLKNLNCENTPVDNLKPLENLRNLESLNISGTQVRNLKSLSNLTKLESLEISNTQVRNLRPLEDLPSLKSLQCFNARLSEKDIERFKEANPDCKVVYY